MDELGKMLSSAGLKVGRRNALTHEEHGARALQQTPRELAPAGKRLDVVRAKGWEKFDWLQHGFSSRAGGTSDVYGRGSLNLGWTKEDDAAQVAENRRRFVRGVTGGEGRLVTVRQTHSGVVRLVEAADGPLETPEGKAVLRGDGVMTDVPGVLLGVQIADCVPVLVADTKLRAVAAFHAGWRGTLRRIVERGVGTMRLRYGSQPKDLVAVIGPSIGACCYSVGEEVRMEFQSQFSYASDLFSEVFEKYPLMFLDPLPPGHSQLTPRVHLDLWEANRRQLIDAGLKAKRIQVIGECTACTRRKNGGLKYFSHRGEHGHAGRMITAIGLKN